MSHALQSFDWSVLGHASAQPKLISNARVTAYLHTWDALGPGHSTAEKSLMVNVPWHSNSHTSHYIEDYERHCHKHSL